LGLSIFDPNLGSNNPAFFRAFVIITPHLFCSFTMRHTNENQRLIAFQVSYEVYFQFRYRKRIRIKPKSRLSHSESVSYQQNDQSIH